MSSLKKELKRARLFEVQKITRRLRALEKRRGSETQLEKNRRKVGRLQNELEHVKNVDIMDLCSKIQAKDRIVIQLSMTEQPPANPDEKAKWRLLTSKTVSGYIKETSGEATPKQDKELVKRDELDWQDCRLPDQRTRVIQREERLAIQDDDKEQEDSSYHRLPRLSPEDREADAQITSRPMDSVFVTSLSGQKVEGGERQQKTGKSVKQRNRLGQRARRKLWEQKYGRKAKHVLQKSITSRKKRNAVVAMATLPSEEPRVKVATSQGTLHPSWVAKKQVQSGIKQFQGQKITFDSD